MKYIISVMILIVIFCVGFMFGFSLQGKPIYHISTRQLEGGKFRMIYTDGFRKKLFFTYPEDKQEAQEIYRALNMKEF